MYLNRFTFIIIMLATFSPAAHAYLDPSTGSMIISAIVGLLASMILAIKTYWYQFIGFLRRVSGRGNANKAQAGAENPNERSGE